MTLLFSGAAFGQKRRVILQLLELPQALKALQGVEMELRDSAFPLIEDIVVTDNVEKAFEGVDYALLVGMYKYKKYIFITIIDWLIVLLFLLYLLFLLWLLFTPLF